MFLSQCSCVWQGRGIGVIIMFFLYSLEFNSKCGFQGDRVLGGSVSCLLPCWSCRMDRQERLPRQQMRLLTQGQGVLRFLTCNPVDHGSRPCLWSYVWIHFYKLSSLNFYCSRYLWVLTDTEFLHDLGWMLPSDIVTYT